ncbi:hypothetical protein INR75_12480 [Zunongwangia sp. SCSIO 43204]|uniref:baeRF7 domain-containing protein n=1 Tax=Zunongwangia sp. SCSIO 43204 TaxID=2779359 RepID=UPI001CA9DA36|nr:hypothetical protein [Zunongwangia sp. SCSIO 43204]UAB83031.1 hypothetical protein INR75_12480 [Zunongwangia sp. SCSIO 43204]
MSLIKKEEFHKLIDYSGKLCVSIFIPTERGGKDVLEKKDQTHLKSQWQQAEKTLKERNISDEALQKIASRIESLLNDPEFWRNQSDGLAIFASEDFFKYYTVPINFEASVYVMNEFYIKPLVPLYNKDERFYLLSLQLEEVSLFEATQYSIGKVDIEDLTPERLEERVGFDYKEKALQFKTQNPNSGTPVYHGHGANERNRLEEIKLYFRAIDQGIHDLLEQDNIRLIVACDDSLFPIYKEANTYNKLYEKSVPGNPADLSMLDLHAKALNLLEPEMRRKLDEKMNAFKENEGTDLASADIRDIFPAIQQGKVDTLFVENRQELWGTYSPDNMKIEKHNEQSLENSSLLNHAVVNVIKQGGEVFLIEHQFMPNKKEKLNALYRFSS